MIKRALISVSDKTGIVELAKGLAGLGVELISTGGTKKKLEEAGVKVMDISDFTGFPEMLDGRLKTLHPKVHGGILAIRSDPEHRKAMNENGIKPIDMVIVNLYPFENAINQKPDDVENAIENIDIGGPTMIRSAAKNYKDVVVVVDPDDYGHVLKELKTKGSVSMQTKERLAVKVFQRAADYNSEIDRFFSEKFLDEKILRMSFVNGKELRYGENPHQHGTYFRDPGAGFEFSQLNGKELSFNNLSDMNAAVSIAGEFDEDECVSVVVKHANPCGVATGKTPLDAFKLARQTDPLSAFGGIISFSREVGLDVAQEINKTFVEVVVAPSFSEQGLQELKQKKDLRVIQISKFPDLSGEHDYKKISGGLLVQDVDTKQLTKALLKTVTEKKPTEEQIQAMLFGWRVLKHVKSNAVIFVGKDRTLGIGAGQMSRIDALQVAVMKAGKSKMSLEGSVLASDAFFPFRDCVDEAVKVGTKAIVQPGGSLRDKESIDAANGHGIAMAFTGFRCFKH